MVRTVPIETSSIRATKMAMPVNNMEVSTMMTASCMMVFSHSGGTGPYYGKDISNRHAR
jgi:hypothetical protein